jgi:hypothetical protein
MGDISKTPKHLEQVRAAVEKVKPYIQKAAPYIRTLHDTYKQYHPVVSKYYEQAKEKVHPDVAIACILLFFGGQFALTIVAVRAFQQSGGTMMKRSWADLQITYREGMATLRKDSELVGLFDKDGDGEVSPMEVASMLYEAVVEKKEDMKQKRIQVLLGAMKCVDPQRLLDACAGLWTGIIAVLATLRSEVARYVTVGTQLGTRAAEFLQAKTGEKAVQAFPQYTKWIDAGYRVAGAVLGIMVAFILTRVVMALASAMEGGRIASDFLITKGKEHHLISEMQVTEHKDKIVYGVAAVGFLFQLWHGFGMPWYLRLFLWPGLIVESTLTAIAMY